jgi:hypothetical protein
MRRRRASQDPSATNSAEGGWCSEREWGLGLGLGVCSYRDPVQLKLLER